MTDTVMSDEQRAAVMYPSMRESAQAAEANKPSWLDGLGKDAAAYHKPVNYSETKQDAGNKAADASKAANTVVEYQDFTLPEGMEVDREVAAEFKAVAKELKLSQDTAQGLVDLQAKLAQKQSEQMTKQWDDVVGGWENKSRQEFSESDLTEIKTTFNRYADAELKELVASTGFGNHPALLRFIRKVGRR